LVSKEEILLKPNEKRTVFFEAAADTQAIGVVGFFINYERTQWKAATGVQPNKTSVIHIFVSGAGLTVR